MVKLTEVPPADPGRDIAEEIAAETIQNTFRRHKECKPAIKLRRINSEEKLVQDIAADVIKSGIKRSNSIKKNKIPGTPPIGKPSPRTTMMEAQEATGKVAWLEVKKIVLQRLEYKRWDDGVDPYIELNGLVKTGVIWNAAGQPLVWTRTDSVVPVAPGENDLNIRVYDANRVRDDILIGECTIDTSTVPDTGPGPTLLTGSVSCPKYRDAKIEVHVSRSSGSNFPNMNEPSIRADHRKLSVDDLDITSDVKKPRDLREEARRLAKEAEQTRSAPPLPAKPKHTAAAREERKAEPAFVPAPPRKEAQPRREAKEAGPVVRPTQAAPKHELPVELQATNAKRRRSKTKTLSPGWLEKNVEAEKKLVIDDAYNASFKKIIYEEGVHLNFGEIAIILNALGHEKATKPPPGYGKSTRDDASESDDILKMDGQNFLDQDIVHIPLSETGSTREIAELFTELVHKIDFGIVGTHGHVSPKSEGKEEVPESDHVLNFAMSKREAKIIKEHLISLVTGMWTRNRNFILLVCGAHPDQGGGRPSNWSISWVQKLATKLDFPEEKFMSCNGLQFLEENRNTVKSVFGIIPSLLQARFALYQHLLRLIEAWWTIPSRPSDRVDSSFKATRRQSLPKGTTGGYVPFEPQTRKPTKRRPTSGLMKRQGKKEIHRMTLSPTYVSKGRIGDSEFDRNLDTLVTGDGVVIGPHLILYPGLLASGRDNGLDVRDHMFEKYAEMIGGRTGLISVFPYGRHSYPGMVWVALKPEDDEDPHQFMRLVKQLEKVDVTDILVSGKHVLVPEVCIMRSLENQNDMFFQSEEQHEVKPPVNYFQTIGLDRRTSTYAPKHLADTGDSNWRDDYSDDGEPAYGGDEEYPPSPELYIGGGSGVRHAVVTAPLPSILPDRKLRPTSAPSTRQHHRNNSSPTPQQSILSFVDPALRESADGKSGWDTIWSNGERGGKHGSPNSTLGRPRSIDDYPTPDKYINGGKGVKKAVVIAPLEDPVPNRTNHEKLPDSPPRDRSGERPLYRPLPDLFSTIVPGDEIRPKSQPSRPRSSRGFHTQPPATAGDHFGDAVEVLKMLSQGLPDIEKNSDMKKAVRTSVDRYNKMDNQLKGSMKKSTPNDSTKPKRGNSFDPLKEPVSSRPKPEAKKKKKKKRWDEDFPASQDEELKKLIERIENISDVEELQDIQDSLAGEFRKRSAKAYGSPVRDHNGVYPDGIIDSMIKYKLNHDGDSNSANLKLKKWGVSPSKPKNPSRSKKSDSDVENAEEKNEGDEIKAPHPLKKEKFIFPWMIGEPRVSDDIDPRKNERLWRALKVAERESSKKEAHLRKQLKRLGVSDENMVVKDPYDTYTNV